MYKFYSFYLTLCLVLFFPLNVFSQTPIQLGERHDFASEILEEVCGLSIYLPPDYERAQSDRYPVLYLLDGDRHFKHLSGLVDFLSVDSREIPPMIVVAVQTSNRVRDFTPVAYKEWGTSGKGDRFQQFFEKELIPHIDETYRTQDYRILMGHSLGGLFSLYTLMQEPDLFQAHLAISPWLIYKDQWILKNMKKLVDNKSEVNGFLYASIGEKEENLKEAKVLFMEQMQEWMPSGLDWSVEVLRNKDHISLVHESVMNGLLTLYKAYPVSEQTLAKGVEAVETHFKRLSNVLGYEIKIPELLLNDLAYEALQIGKAEQAIDMFKKNVENYPHSSNVYDSLADGYEQNMQYQEAKKNYLKAVELATKYKDQNLALFQKNLKRIQQMTK